LTDQGTAASSMRTSLDNLVPGNADVQDIIKVILVDELDDSNSLDVKGVGEVGVVGVPAAIANAVYHATGRRIRDLPITLDKLLT
jgi:xanthine dehydrogenase YagR molybdenum-binding subunit